MLRALADAFRDYGKTGIDLIVSRYDSPSQSSNRGAYKDLMIAVGPEIADSISKLLKGRSFFENRDTFDILRSIKNPRVATLMLPYLADEEVAEHYRASETKEIRRTAGHRTPDPDPGFAQSKDWN
jgi:hypothetical protein